jgi:hypothetical protein
LRRYAAGGTVPSGASREFVVGNHGCRLLGATVLQRVLGAARELTGAHYAALGVLDAERRCGSPTLADERHCGKTRKPPHHRPIYDRRSGATCVRTTELASVIARCA